MKIDSKSLDHESNGFFDFNGPQRLRNGIILQS